MQMTTLTATADCVSNWSAAPEDVRDQIAALEAFIARLSVNSPWLRPGAERRLADARAHLARLEGDTPITEPLPQLPVCLWRQSDDASPQRAQRYEALGRDFDIARRDSGLSVEALAERALVCPLALGAWLEGDGAHPIGVDVLQRLARALDLRVEVVSDAPPVTVTA